MSVSVTLADLLATGRLEAVPADGPRAEQQMADAGRHLDSAHLLLDTDLAGAYQLAYEAARKALTAHMAANGLRVRGSKGGHHVVGEYATTLPNAHEFAAFDRMRRNRNRSAYATRVFSRSEVVTDLARAVAMVEAVRSLLV